MSDMSMLQDDNGMVPDMSHSFSILQNPYIPRDFVGPKPLYTKGSQAQPKPLIHQGIQATREKPYVSRDLEAHP